MTRQRITPFGYKVENGRTVPHPVEAKAVRWIFGRYLRGDSYLVIAKAMTAGSVRYHADSAVWNKHMVKRILENEGYTGAGGWPEIISADIFNRASQIRISKTAGWREHPACNDAVKRKLVCAACSAPFKIQTSSCGDMRWWHCSNDECGNTLKLTDAELEHRVIFLLNRLISQPRSLDMLPASVSLSPESERIQKGVHISRRTHD